jgi:two-component system chemotaxis sensor kinase CheA
VSLAARDDIKARLLATFRVEAEEHLRSLTASLLELDEGLPAERSAEAVERTFRAMHTLKGAARSVGLVDVEALGQACELVLSRIVRGGQPLTPGIVASLQEAVAGIAELLAGRIDPATARELADRVERAGGTTALDPVAEPRRVVAPADEPARERAGADTIRVDAAKLDALLLQAEELIAAKLAADERTREARSLVAAIARLRRELQRASMGTRDGVDLAAELRQAEARGRALVEHLARDQQAIAAAVDGLLEEIRRTRMMPVATVLDLFPAMVSDLAREQGKEIQWSARGGELEADRRVLEAIKDPLIHVVRNAVDHGIESPAERVAAGKNRRGRIAAFVSSLEDGRLEIVIEDDGRGIDAERVRAAAVRGRLVAPEEAQALTDEEALELVFRSGVSTSPVITAVSGHGLGLAIVREQVERLEGAIELDGQPGATRIRMVLPASIATFHGLLVRSAGRGFLIPIRATEQVVRVERDAVGTVDGREAIQWQGRPVVVARLDALLELRGEDGDAGDEDGRRCVVISSGQDTIGLLVDEVAGEQEVLVKDLSPPLRRVRYIAGAGVLGTGQIVLILRAADLVRAGRRARRPPAPRPVAAEKGRAPLVLVVDDAVTTRTMERNLLEAAGYRVQVAVDGAEAWAALRTDEFDLVLSDVDMPRMDGFDLTARIRADPGLRDLPVVLVTALESREDKERGIEVGANAYVVKSSFEQSNLLEILRRLGVAPVSGAGS